MYYTPFVKVPDTGHQLSKEPPGSIVLEISMVEDVIKQLAAGRILENDTNMSFRLDHLVKADNIGMMQPSKNCDFAVDLGKAVRVIPKGFSSYELDGDLNAALLFPAHLDLAKFALADSLSKNVFSKLGLPLWLPRLEVFLSASRTSSSTIIDTFASYKAQSSDGCDVCAYRQRSCLGNTSSLALNVFLWIRNDESVDHGAVFSR